MMEMPVQELLESPDQEGVRADLAAFFGKNAGRYLAKYERLRAAGPGKILLSWNWAAFGYNFPWFFYRKCISLGALFALPPLAAYFDLPWAGNIALVISLIFPAFADHWYVQHALRHVARARSLGLGPAERLEQLRRFGGVSTSTGALALALYLALVVLGTLSTLRESLPGLLP